MTKEEVQHYLRERKKERTADLKEANAIDPNSYVAGHERGYLDAVEHFIGLLEDMEQPL